MKAVGKWLGRFLLVILLAVGALWAFGPREPVETEMTFDPGHIGEDLDAWLAAQEADVPNLRPGAEKRIVWVGEPGTRTAISVVYLHGFSADAEEIRPVPDLLANGLGANLYFARFQGHGRDGPAMAEPRAGDWLDDFAEAMEVGRRIGDAVIVLSTSTGGAISTVGAFDPVHSQGVKAQIFVSPNFEMASPLAPVLSWPLARHWMPLLAGRERSFEPHNEKHGQHWTTRYPSEAVFPLAAIVKHARLADHAQINHPALFVISDADQVVKASTTRDIAANWGGPAKVEALVMGEGDDPFSHVIAGDIMSPGQTEAAAQLMVDWVRALD